MTFRWHIMGSVLLVMLLLPITIDAAPVPYTLDMYEVANISAQEGRMLGNDPDRRTSGHVEIYTEKEVSIYVPLRDHFTIENYGYLAGKYREFMEMEGDLLGDRETVRGSVTLEGDHAGTYQGYVRSYGRRFTYPYSERLVGHIALGDILIGDRGYSLLADPSGEVKVRIVDIRLPKDGSEKRFVIAGMQLFCSVVDEGIRCASGDEVFTLSQGEQYVLRGGIVTLLEDPRYDGQYDQRYYSIAFLLLFEPGEVACPNEGRGYFYSHCRYIVDERDGCVVDIEERCSSLVWMWQRILGMFGL